MTALFSPQYLKWQELAKIFSVNKNWWQALTALLSRSESSRQLPPSLALSHQGIQKMLKVIQYRTHGDSLNQAQINWRGFIVNRWLSSACFEPFSLNTSRGIFQGAQASPALLPWTIADLSGSRVGWQQLRLHGGAGAVFAGWALWPRPNPRAKVPHHPPVRPSIRPSVHPSRLPGHPPHEPAGAHHRLAHPFPCLWASSQKRAGWRGNSLHLYLPSRWSWVRAKIRTYISSAAGTPPTFIE